MHDLERLATRASLGVATPRDLGSMRNARVAIPTDSGRIRLTFLASSMSVDDLAELGEVAPNVKILVGLSKDEALKVAPKTPSS